MEQMHSDESNDLDLIQQALEPIVTVIQQILDKQAAMDDELDALCKLVNEEILGGITSLYKTHERASGISSLSEKYGPIMGKYKDFYSEMSDGKDIYEALWDELEELKSSTENLDDSAVDAKVQELADLLKTKFEKVRGMKGDEPEVSIEVEVEKEPEVDQFEKIKQLKKRLGKRGEF